MYEVEFYRDKNEKSEIVEYLDDLKEKAKQAKASASIAIKSLRT